MERGRGAGSGSSAFWDHRGLSSVAGLYQLYEPVDGAKREAGQGSGDTEDRGLPAWPVDRAVPLRVVGGGLACVGVGDRLGVALAALLQYSCRQGYASALGAAAVLVDGRGVHAFHRAGGRQLSGLLFIGF